MDQSDALRRANSGVAEPNLIRIPFNRPTFEGNEFTYIQQALDSWQISGNGPFTQRCEEELETLLGVERALLTTSCTHALEMSALLLEVGEGDEVIMPSFTFVSVANAFVLRGARPVFIDIRPDTLNIDEKQLEGLITDRTAAIVPVHYAGVGCEMDEIMEIADRRGVPVVEDNAHGLFGSYKSRNLGTFGKLATLSFHETKNISCGEGGALLINDPGLVDRAEIMREKGTDRSQYFRGEVAKYTWRDVGSSYTPSDILAAVLCAQFENREWIVKRRHEIWTSYQLELADWAHANGVRQPTVPAYCESTHHIYFLVLPTQEAQRRLIGGLREQGILSVFHYQPLHLSAYGSQISDGKAHLPVTEFVSDRIVRLPLYNHLDENDLSDVIEAVRGIRVS
ncbi:MAG TPA: dTDP-4-amino-4,6-dideoxygalactose transaminase [Actinomycetota bacterium]|nr:dTDP-4-amino-4,6-dideoxygalactose transaminase [Actinomycetota bacterium]